MKLEEAIAKAMDDALGLNDSAVVQVLAKAALAAIEREGWKAVPVEPTEEMLAAGDVETESAFDDSQCAAASVVWSNMLSASPKQ